MARPSTIARRARLRGRLAQVEAGGPLACLDPPKGGVARNGCMCAPPRAARRAAPDSLGRRSQPLLMALSRRPFVVEVSVRQHPSVCPEPRSGPARPRPFLLEFSDADVLDPRDAQQLGPECRGRIEPCHS